MFEWVQAGAAPEALGELVKALRGQLPPAPSSSVCTRPVRVAT
jgi:hypothetical protein